MANYDSNYAIAQEISARIGASPIPFDSVYSIALEIYNELGGEPTQFDSVYSILLGILPLVEGGIASKVIDDSVITTVKTWSSSKLSSELATKQNTLTAGTNIDITNDTISAKGYIFNGDTNGGFAEKYKQDSGDGGQIVANTATGLGSHAEGYTTTASGDYGSHAEGYETTASGEISHAEGYSTTASGNYGSHAEGYQSVASGEVSHAEGSSTASSYYSHAEGQRTTASGNSSHSEGAYTTAQNITEHAEGYCNVSHKATSTSQYDGNAGNTQHSVGIGNGSSARKNAFEIMQNGDMYVFGVGGYQGTNTKVQDASIKTMQGVISDINTSVAGKQDTLTAGSNITISGNTISATDTTYVAGSGITISGNSVSVDSNLLSEINGKQDELVAGTNITISGTTISATYQTATTADIEALFS